MPERLIFGLRFSPLSSAEIADQIAVGVPSEHSANMLYTANLDHVVKMRHVEGFRQAYRRADIITADGFPIYFYARLRGVKLPGRVTGADLFPEIIARLTPERCRPFFVVSDIETALRVEVKLAKRNFLFVQTLVPPFGFEDDADYSSQLASKIRMHGTTHLFFCVGAPKSEIWLDYHRQKIGACHAMALGAGANFFTGTASRAPKWVQKVHSEWLWRVVHDPRRLFRRYFIESWAFLLAIKEDLMGKATM